MSLVGIVLVLFPVCALGKDVSIFLGHNPYNWMDTNTILYNYKGFFNPMVDLVKKETKSHPPMVLGGVMTAGEAAIEAETDVADSEEEKEAGTIAVVEALEVVEATSGGDTSSVQGTTMMTFMCKASALQIT